MNILVKFINKFKKNYDISLVNEQEQASIRNVETLLDKYGFIDSLLLNECVDKELNPIPWYTYPAIEYISQLNLLNKKVFEYGVGNSSLFWAKRSQMVVSVDNNLQWYNLITKKAPYNLKLSYQDNMDEYVDYIDKFNYKFDIIVIDGAFRYQASRKALSAISDNGLIVLDNSDRAVAYDEYANATKLLRDGGLIQVDMSGFGPLNHYTWTTSLFFTRNFNFRTVDDIQPHKPIGGNVSPFN